MIGHALPTAHDVQGAGRVQLAGTGLCLATIAPRSYVQACVRVYQQNVFRVRPSAKGAV